MITANACYDIVIVGSGPAGQNAALEAARRGARVLIIERERQPGGACVQYGTIPSKTLRETALTLTAFQRRSGGTWRLSHDAQLRVHSLMRRLDEVVQAHQQTTADCLAMAGIECLTGNARFQSEHELIIHNVKGERRTVEGRTIVIATGSRPRSPQHIPVDHENILDSDSILSMTYLPASLIVIGSGVIACEYASTFAALGVQVVMVDKWPTPLGFLDDELIEVFRNHFENAGGKFRGDCEVVGCEWDGVSAVRVRLASGEVLTADKAFVALGRDANLDALEIGRVGLQLNARGVLDVNPFCQTVVPHIYAVGDTIGPPALASASMEQGRRAAIHALSGDGGHAAALIPTGIYTIPEIATVGLTEREVIARGQSAVVGRASYTQVARAHIMASACGVLKLVADGNGQKLLGVQIAGDNATELIHLGQMAVLGNLPVDVFVNSIFNFPTMAEAYRLAALQILHSRDQGPAAGHAGVSAGPRHRFQPV